MPLLSRKSGLPGKGPRARCARPRRAFTLLELVLAAALTALVLVGLQSAVLIATKAIPPATEKADTASQGAALNRMALDLAYAKTIVRAQASLIEFTVADRNGDAADDTIIYSWNSTSRQPLLRQFNGGTAETILGDVTAFTMSLQTEVVTGVTTYVDSSETLLASYNTGTTSRYSVDTLTWGAQYIPVTLLPDTVDFRTTRMRIYARASGSATGTTAIEIRSTRNRLPTSRVYGTATLNESSLSGASSWINVPIASVRNLDPNESIGVVMRSTLNGPSMDAEYRASGAAATSGVMYTSADAGGTWTTVSGGAFFYELWGVCRSVSSTTTVTRGKFLLVSVQAYGNAAIELNLPLANRPVVSP